MNWLALFSVSCGGGRLMPDQKPEIFVHTTPKVGVCKDDSDHDFQGWRDFPDGNGGEQVCAKCGLGAMAWTLRVGP